MALNLRSQKRDDSALADRHASGADRRDNRGLATPRAQRGWLRRAPVSMESGHAAAGRAKWAPVGHPALPLHRESSSSRSCWFGWALYLGSAVLLVAVARICLPQQRLLTNDITQPVGPLLTVGLIGIWRWSWSACHLVRAIIYRRWQFPRLRRAAEQATPPSRLYCIVPSYRMKQEVNAAVYGRLFEQIAAYGVPSIVVALITDPADAHVITKLFGGQVDLPPGTQLHFLPQAGTGKRDAMADALQFVAQQHPPARSQVILMDGDSLLGAQALAKACSLLAALPDVGALTAENVPIVKGSALAREWYRLRMAHRDNLMCSMSLSRRVLVLTGRFSVYRAEIATTPEFILTLRRDVLDHWWLGRIVFLTGDDKSTWFSVLRQGWNMLYVPDAIIHPIEELPQDGFVKSANSLMMRWYGNMVRGNSRALKLGPARCGWFLWVCLIDQRISMWTTLVGPTAMVVTSILYGPIAILYYLLWVLVSRGLVCLIYFISTGKFHPLFPLILYFNQELGAVLKIYSTFHPHRQKWTRQRLKGSPESASHRLRELVAHLYAAIGVLLFILATVMVVGVVNITERNFGAHISILPDR